jgi:hypothetical protein
VKRSLALGALLIVAGFVGVALPGLTAWVPAVESLPLLVAAAATIAGVAALRSRLNTARESHRPAEREPYGEAPTPGTEFDDLLAEIRPLRSRADGRQRDRARGRLEQVAVDVLTREGHSEAAARDLLASGEWTDDPVAAALFATDPPPMRFDRRVSSLFDRTPTFTRRARRAIDVLAARASAEAPAEADG